MLRRDDDEGRAGRPAGIGARRRPPATAPFTGLTEVRLGIGGDCRHVVVADDTDERATGLMRRNDLGSYDGMLFVFDEPTSSSFTMSDVPVPLDIGWYDAAGRPVDRLLMQPCPDGTVSDCPAYSSGGTYSYAVETLGGELPGGALSVSVTWSSSASPATVNEIAKYSASAA